MEREYGYTENMNTSKAISIITDINVGKLAKQILRNEPKIIKKYPAKSWDYSIDFDGETGLGYNSLTSRSCHFNLLNWWGTGEVKKWIRKGYEKYSNIEGTPLYVQCWANVMRCGEQIKSHRHSEDFSIGGERFLCGHLSVQVDGSTSTYYDGTPLLNENGMITFFPGYVSHWTNRYEGHSERITVAFDIYNKEFFEYDMEEGAKKHWIRI